MTLVMRPGYGGAAVSDPDAMAYLQAVEVADNQALEQGVQQAVNQFVIGCKADGIWNAIKASCILAGARTLEGALVPLAGTAPTNFNFASGDYNRKTGLVGDGSTKYLNTNRNNNADPQNSKHLAAYISTTGISLNMSYIATEFAEGGSHISVSSTSASSLGLRSNSSGAIWPGSNSNTVGFTGHSRASSAGVSTRANGVGATADITSETPLNRALTLYARNASPPTNYSNARLAFYSIGESLDLALLDARVTTLINAFAAAIP